MSGSQPSRSSAAAVVEMPLLLNEVTPPFFSFTFICTIVFSDKSAASEEKRVRRESIEDILMTNEQISQPSRDSAVMICCRDVDAAV